MNLSQTSSNFSITAHKSTLLNPDERYLDQNLTRLSKIFEDEMKEARELLQTKLKLDSFDSYGIRSQESLILFGRISEELSFSADGLSNSSKKVVILEGDNIFDNGKRIRLDFSSFNKAISLLPGQIIAVKGMCPSGKSLIVNELYKSIKPLVDVRTTTTKTFGGELKVMISSGPLTLKTNLNYENLEQIIKQCLKQKPDVFVLLGPLIDSQNSILSDQKMMMNGVECTESKVLYFVFSRIFKLASSCPEMKILILPSVNDFTKEFCLPQPSFSLTEELATLIKPRNVYLFQNPSVFNVPNIERSIAVVSDDVVTDLSMKEYVVGKSKTNLTDEGKLIRIATHILENRSFYPMFPPMTVSVDYTKQEALKLPVLPDILIVPSKQKRNSIATNVFIKNGNETKTVLVVSPSKIEDSINQTVFSMNQKQPTLAKGVQFISI